MCGKAFEPVALDIRSLDGGAQPKSDHDQAQVNRGTISLAHHSEVQADQGGADVRLTLLCLLQRNIKLPGGCHKGELTKLGQNQAHEVGDWLRNRYIHELGFLPTQYKVHVPAPVTF